MGQSQKTFYSVFIRVDRWLYTCSFNVLVTKAKASSEMVLVEEWL